MLEELRETVLTDLEQRVERAIDMIQQLRQDKLTLESQISELHEQIQQKDAQIESLENRNAELQYAESELEALQVQREQERDDIDLEKAELRDRLEGVMKLLNGVEDGLETSPEHPTAAEDEPITTAVDESFAEDKSAETSESPVDEESTEAPESSPDADTPVTEDVETETKRHAIN